MKPKVSIVGGINLDIEGKPFEKLVYQDSNPGHIRITHGGVGRNIAENLLRMGGSCSMVSVIGEDSMGRSAKEELRLLGGDVSMVKEIPGRNSSIYLSILQDNSDMELALSDMDIVNEITPEFLAPLEEELKKSAIVALDGNLTEELLTFACDMLEGTPLFFDPVSASKAHRAKHVIGRFYAVKPNTIEAEVLTGIKIECEADVVKAADALLQKGVKQVFITMNKDGVYYTDGNQSGFLRPCRDPEIASATGAGDAFSAAVLLGFTKGMTIEETAAMGMAASSMAMRSESAVNPEITFEEVMGVR